MKAAVFANRRDKILSIISNAEKLINYSQCLTSGGEVLGTRLNFFRAKCKIARSTWEEGKLIQINICVPKIQNPIGHHSCLTIREWTRGIYAI